MPDRSTWRQLILLRNPGCLCVWFIIGAINLTQKKRNPV